MKQVMEALENARANLDQAIAGLEKIPEIDAETVGYTAHKLKNYAKDLVEKLGGSIWCESHPGCGAAFHVRLPAFRKNL